MKVKDIPYERYFVETFLKAAEKQAKRVREARSAEEVLAAWREMNGASIEFETADSLAYIRYALNTRDPFYRGEHEYYSEVSPRAEEAETRFGKAVLASPFLPDLEKKVNPLAISLLKLKEKTVSDAVVEDMKEENALVDEYSDFMSELTVSFRGQALPLSLLKKYMKDADRSVRREAYAALGEKLEESAEILDGIFDRLVAVRDRLAKKMGYSDFTQLAYYRMQRLDYDRDKVQTFRKNVISDVVPAVSRVKSRIGKSMGIDDFSVYDDEVFVHGGDPRPVGDKSRLFDAAREMYADMSAETGEFFDFMLATEAFDVDAREGKWGGGCCTSFMKYRQPFILANFNGTSQDVDVLTHEAGHALADYLMYRDNPYYAELGVGGMETAETHSMSMEFFAWKYAEKFFGADADKYKYMHLADAFCFIPYGTMVDEFQHIVYAEPHLSPAQRNEVWLELEKKYRPWQDLSQTPGFGKGRRWQYQMHIYESPFYYIDYCLAQFAALGFLFASREDYGGAFARYLELVRQGGRKTFTDLLREAGLRSPFEEGTLAKISEAAEKLIYLLFEKIA